MGAAVGIEQHGERAGLPVPALLGQEHRGGDLAAPGPQEGDPRADQRRLGVVGDLRSTQDPGDAALTVQSGRPDDHRLATAPAGVHAGLHDERRGGGTVAEPPETHTRCICNRVGGEEQRMADDAHDGPHLQLGRGQRHAGGDQPSRAFVVGRHDDAAVVEHRGRTVHELHPGLIAVLEQHGGPDRLVFTDGGGQDLQVTLVPALHREHDAPGFRPLHVGQIRERGAIPLDLTAGAVEGEHPERHLGVVRPGRRIGVLLRRLVRPGRIADPPAGHGGGVDPRGGDGRAVGRPPVAPAAVHLLGRHEVRRAPRDVLTVLPGQHPAGAVQLGHAQVPAVDVGQAAAERLGPWIEHRTVHHELPGGPREEPGHEQAAGQGERGHRHHPVGGVGHHPAGPFPRPLAAGPLLGRQVALVPGQEGAGIGDEALLADHRRTVECRLDLEDPQAVDGIAAALRARRRPRAAPRATR